MSTFASRNSTYGTFYKDSGKGNRSSLPHLLSLALDLGKELAPEGSSEKENVGKIRKVKQILLEKTVQKQTVEEEKNYF